MQWEKITPSSFKNDFLRASLTTWPGLLVIFQFRSEAWTRCRICFTLTAITSGHEFLAYSFWIVAQV